MVSQKECIKYAKKSRARIRTHSTESAALQWNTRIKISKPRMDLFKKGGAENIGKVKFKKCLKCEKKIMTTPENRLCSACKIGGLFFGSVQEQVPIVQGKKRLGQSNTGGSICL